MLETGADVKILAVVTVDEDGNFVDPSAGGGGGGSTPSEAEYGTGQVSASTLDSNGTTWAALVTDLGAGEMALVEVFNATDCTLEVSFDGGATVHARIPAYGAISRDLAANSLKETAGASSGVHVREWATDPIVSSDGYVLANASWAA
jgi:hypothetical protein